MPHRMHRLVRRAAVSADWTRAPASTVGQGAYFSSRSLEARQLLADLPLAGIGTLSTALIAFWLLNRRLNLAIAAISMSGLLVFFSAIADIANILRGEQSAFARPSSPALDALSGTSLALAVAFRLLFLVYRTEQASRFEQPVQLKREDVPRLFGRFYVGPKFEHSATWSRFGTVGHVLRSGLLVEILAILVLDFVWRVVSGVSIDDLEGASTALQIVVLVTIAFKMAVSAYLNPARPQSRNFVEVAPLALAIGIMLITLFIDVKLTGFTETALGRTLLAIALFIMLVETAVRDAQAPIRDWLSFESNAQQPRETSFKGLGGQSRAASTFRLSPPSFTNLPVQSPRRQPRSSYVEVSCGSDTHSRLLSWLALPSPPIETTELGYLKDDEMDSLQVRYMQTDPARQSQPPFANLEPDTVLRTSPPPMSPPIAPPPITTSRSSDSGITRRDSTAPDSRHSSLGLSQFPKPPDTADSEMPVPTFGQGLAMPADVPTDVRPGTASTFNLRPGTASSAGQSLSVAPALKVIPPSPATSDEASARIVLAERRPVLARIVEHLPERVSYEAVSPSSDYKTPLGTPPASLRETLTTNSSSSARRSPALF